MISKLNEEKSSAMKQNQKLRQELVLDLFVHLWCQSFLSLLWFSKNFIFVLLVPNHI
jgi:hypothetical protein